MGRLTILFVLFLHVPVAAAQPIIPPDPEEGDWAPPPEEPPPEQQPPPRREPPPPQPQPYSEPAADQPAASDGGGGGGVRVAFEGRISALNVVLGQGFFGGTDVGNLVPIVAIGVRLVDTRLYLGLGLGFFGVEDDVSGFSMSPVVSYDVISQEWGALDLVGWLNFIRTNDESGIADQDAFHFGMNLGLGMRGHITEGISIGTEWGWGFLLLDNGPGNGSTFAHGAFGTILVEASIGVGGDS